MYILFGALLLTAIVFMFVSAAFEVKGLDGVGLVLALAAGIILAIEVTKTPSKSSTNPYFLGTFLVIVCVGVAMAIGFNLGEWLKKKKEKK